MTKQYCTVMTTEFSSRKKEENEKATDSENSSTISSAVYCTATMSCPSTCAHSTVQSSGGITTSSKCKVVHFKPWKLGFTFHGQKCWNRESDCCLLRSI